MNKHPIKCEYCGRFISYKDLEAGIATAEMVYSGYPPEPDHEAYCCGECNKVFDDIYREFNPRGSANEDND